MSLGYSLFPSARVRKVPTAQEAADAGELQFLLNRERRKKAKKCILAGVTF